MKLLEALILFSWGVFETYRLNKYIFSNMLLKGYFSRLCGLKDKTRSCRLCVVLLLQTAVPSVCFRVWHLPLGRRNWHVSPFIADWFHCAGGLYFIASWFQSSRWLAAANGIKRDFDLYSFFYFIFLYEIFLRNGPELNLVTHFPF